MAKQWVDMGGGLSELRDDADSYKNGYAPQDALTLSGYTPAQQAAYYAQPKEQVYNTGNLNLSGMDKTNWANGGAWTGGTPGFAGVQNTNMPPLPPASSAAAPWSAPTYGIQPVNFGIGTTQMPSSTSQSTTSGNPYLSSMADEIGRRSNQALGQAFSGIRSHAIGVGGLGGSRQGVAQGVATGMANDALTGNLTNLYGTDWANQQNRDLSRYGMDQGFYTAQRGQDLQSVGLGADLFSRGINGQWDSIRNASSIYSPYTGLGTTTQGGTSGGGWQGALGGALAGASAGRQFGWW